MVLFLVNPPRKPRKHRSFIASCWKHDNVCGPLSPDLTPPCHLCDSPAPPPSPAPPQTPRMPPSRWCWTGWRSCPPAPRPRRSPRSCVSPAPSGRQDSSTPAPEVFLVRYCVTHHCTLTVYCSVCHWSQYSTVYCTVLYCTVVHCSVCYWPAARSYWRGGCEASSPRRTDPAAGTGSAHAGTAATGGGHTVTTQQYTPIHSNTSQYITLHHTASHCTTPHHTLHLISTPHQSRINCWW